MKGEVANNNIKKGEIATYLDFLQTLSKSTDDYMYLLELQAGIEWMFGNADKDFDLGPKLPEGCYPGGSWVNCTHPKDRPFLEEDVAKILAGEKDSHNMDYRVRKKNGSYVWINCKGTIQKDQEGRPYLMVGRISEAALRYKIDSLTGLFNVEQMKGDMKQALEEGRKGFFLLLGIDNLKNINTRHGRLMGDEALKQMANTLERLSGSPKIYRIGGDIFALPLYDVSEQAVRDFYAEIQKAVHGQFTVSGGAVELDIPDMDIQVLIQYSEFALRKTKKIGKNGLTIFDMEDYRKEEASLSLLGELVDSVQNGCQGFSLVYQPQIRTGGYKIFGAEALLRYQSPARGRVFPDEFIPILERSELMYPVGLWVLRTALEQCRKWREKMPDFHISVNISYSQLSKPHITEDVLAALKDSGLPGEALTLEVTESMQLQNFPYFNEIFSAWKKAGIYISVDDFGTGYSSLGYLKNLYIDEIKIDRCFVSGIQSSSYNYRLLSNMVELAAGSQIRVCCEGVEEEDELQVLEDLSPDLLQGYLFSRPCEIEEFERLSFDMEDPEYRRYMASVRKIRGNRIGKLLNLQHREILKSVEIGLWIVRIADNGAKYELYPDTTSKRLFGIDRKLTPAESYQYWCERVRPDCREYINQKTEEMLKEKRVVRLQYFWNHPEYGELEIVCAGVRMEDTEGDACIQGYQRILRKLESNSSR